MQIQIMGNMKLSKEMLKIQKELEQLGRTANVPIGNDEHLRDSSLVDNLEEV